MSYSIRFPARKEPGLTTYTFNVVVELDEDRWHVSVPGLKHLGAATWGCTREEALTHVREVVEMIVAELVEDGEPIPAAAQSEPLSTALLPACVEP